MSTSPSDFTTVNPVSGQNIRTYSYCSELQIENQLDQVFKAWCLWRTQSIQQRSEFLFRLSQALLEKKETLASSMTNEMGKLKSESISEVEKSAQACLYFAENLEDFLSSRFVDESKVILMQSLGPVFAVMPWNFPLWQVIRCAAPALGVGNVVVLKHSDLVAGTAQIIQEIFMVASNGVPVFCNLAMTHDQAARVIGDTRIRAVSFTGSTRGGRQVAESCGRALKKVVLELGGSDPYVVFADADLSSAAKACVQSRMINNGQSCIAAKRFIVEKSIKSEFLSLVESEFAKYPQGDPNSAQSRRGPLAHKRFQLGLRNQVHTLLGQGAKLVIGNQIEDEKSAHAYYPAQLIEVDSPLMKSFTEELFGPVAMISYFSGEESDALRMANDTLYGLGAAVFTADRSRAQRMVQGLECGFVSVNDFVRSQPDLPFGGVKSSGFGRELSKYGLEEFANIKSSQVFL